MANLESIHYVPHFPAVNTDGQVSWVRDHKCKNIEHLPQVFWADGSPWIEANLWAFDRATSGRTDIKTVQSNVSHLHKYASWLESEKIDWRHFPMLERDRALFRWRKYLIEQRDNFGLLSPSTTSQRMRATIQFYRYAKANDWIGKGTPLWQERKVLISFHDVHGFERTMQRSTTNLSIPNRTRHGSRLEGGLLPLTHLQMRELLDFTAIEANASLELHLMLQLGFYTGARIETITDLKRETLSRAIIDPATPGLVYLGVGPGHIPAVATKFDVQGRIMLPHWLYESLLCYLGDVRRLRREALASPPKKDLVFLTKFGNGYAERNSGSGTAIDRALVDLRRKSQRAGMKFVRHFHFHVTRATFGTWLTTTLMENGTNTNAVLTFVSNALMHKDISTTMKYIKFVEQTKIKIAVANEFSEVFLGLNKRHRCDHA